VDAGTATGVEAVASSEFGSYHIVRLIGRDTVIEFDPSKPSGQPRRLCDTTAARTRLGFKAEVTLGEGLARTINWYRERARGASQAPARP